MATSTRKKSRRKKSKTNTNHAGSQTAAPIKSGSSESTVAPSPVPSGSDTDQSRVARNSLFILATIAVIHAIYFARAILFPITLAIVLYFLLAPLVRLLTRFRPLSETIAASIVVLGVSAGLALASYVLSGPVANWVASAPETLRKAEEKLHFMTEPVGKIDEATEKVSNITDGSDQDAVKVSIAQPPVTSYLLSATVNFMAGTAITVVLVYLLLALGHRTLNSVVELIPTMEDKRGFIATLRDVEQGISTYLLTITTINILLGVAIGTALGLLKLPDPILLGIMACALNFIPFVGCIVGTVITFLIAVVFLETPTQALVAPLLYFGINSIEGNLITPLALGRSMKLNPVMVFIFLVFWGWVWGVGGVLIAVPLLGILKIVCDNTESLKPVSHILTG